MITRTQIVEEGRQWIGAPYLHQGRSRYGIDCLGLIILTLQKVGMKIPDHCNYPPQYDARQLLEGCQKYLQQISTANINIGSILLFQVYNQPRHLAIATNRGMIHIRGGRSSHVTEVPIPPQWQKRIHSVYDVPGVIKS